MQLLTSLIFCHVIAFIMKFITSSFRFYKIKLKEIFESEKQLFLILELVTGGELFDRLEFYFYSES